MLRLLRPLSLLLIFLSLPALSQDKPIAPPKVTPEVQKLLDEGNKHLPKYEWQLALQEYEKARDLARTINDAAGEAISLGNIGVVYANTGQPQRAMEFYQRALPLFQQIGDKRREAVTLNNLGLIYNNIGQSQKAQEFFQKALPVFQLIGSKNGEASVLTNLGLASYNIGQNRKAIDFYQKALLLYRQTADKNDEALTLTNLGVVYFDIGQDQRAIESYQNALLLFQQLGNKNGKADIFNNLGRVYYNLRQYQKAKEFFQQALSFNQQTGDKNGEANTLNNLGAVSFDIGQPREAIKFFSQSLAVQADIRNSLVGSSENSQQYAVTNNIVYKLLLTIQTEQHNDTNAFAVLQSGKGRSLLDQSVQTKGLLAAIPAEKQAELRRLGRELDRHSLTFMALQIRGGTTDKEKAELEAAQTALRSTEYALQNEQDRQFASYPAAWKTPKTITLAETVKFIPADTVLLDYAAVNAKKLITKKWDEHLLFVVTVENGKPFLTVHPLPITNEVMAEKADSLRDACANPARRYKIAAQELAAKLLPPAVLKRIAGKKRLIICPDGAIWNVPFAALVLPNGKHLLEQYEIDYAYSASGVQQALNAKRGSGQGTLAVANPAFGDETRFGLAKQPDVSIVAQVQANGSGQRPLSDPARGSFTRRGGLTPLPGTQAEADTLHSIFPDAMIITQDKAQEAEIVKELPKYRYLHFATHGVVNNVAPLQSAIVLAAPLKDSEDDGFLTAREIMGMKLNAEMAVLSACETARGEIKPGEGVVGLTWAFSAAGVPTQVVSQWKISDASTPVLMKHFYGNLKAGQKKGQALRNAALAMMRDGKHAHPYHWASFVLFGDWR